MLVNALQPLKAQKPIVVTLGGMVKLVNAVLINRKALSPIFVTLDGMVTLFNPLQSKKV